MTQAEKMARGWLFGKVYGEAFESDVLQLIHQVAERTREECSGIPQKYIGDRRSKCQTWQYKGLRKAIRNARWEDEDDTS